MIERRFQLIAASDILLERKYDPPGRKDGSGEGVPWLQTGIWIS